MALKIIGEDTSSNLETLKNLFKSWKRVSVTVSVQCQRSVRVVNRWWLTKIASADVERRGSVWQCWWESMAILRSLNDEREFFRGQSERVRMSENFSEGSRRGWAVCCRWGWTKSDFWENHTRPCQNYWIRSSWHCRKNRVFYVDFSLVSESDPTRWILRRRLPTNFFSTSTISVTGMRKSDAGQPSTSYGFANSPLQKHFLVHS